jgi:hypothetical protein
MSARNFDLREPSLDAYVKALDAADVRWAAEAQEIALSREMDDGSFEGHDAVVEHGMVVVPGSGDYEGWTLSGYADKSARDGYHMTTPAPKGQSSGSTVGFVVLNRDGTWTACHDAYNLRPGIGLGCTGTKVKSPSAEAAYRYVVAMQARHEKRFAR